jgi:type II secretory pathway pseudopilin PulG
MNKNKGIVLVNVLIFASISILVVSALVNWGAVVLKTTRTLDVREQAFQIAEAGIEYYRWHLAHAPADYQDGTGVTKTYYHTVTDNDGDIKGQYALTITPPPVGSTIVKIRSVGTTTADATISRTIQATLAIPSLAKFAVVANDKMRFGATTEVFGPIHSNQGIRFDGLAHNIITSSVSSYDDTDPDDCNVGLSFGVHTCASPSDPSPPTALPNRSDIFNAGRQFPVQSFDFSGLTVDLATIKTNATASGRYIPSSGSQGYYIVLKTNDTFDLYKVTALENAPNGCSNDAAQTGWGTWSIKTKVHPTTGVANSPQNYPIPANGLIFVEDHVWVSGTINTARVTIAAGLFPDNIATRKDIIVNNDIMYTNYDGSDVISLIAQGNVSTGLISEDNLRIDAALVAQNGRAGRFYYGSGCKISGTNYYVRTQLTLYGMIATNQRYGFAYTGGTGYQSRDIIYDSNLLYGPPPSFPLTSSQYSTISWEEI